MRLVKILTITSKDLKIFRTKKSILYSMIGFQLFISIGLPMIIRFVSLEMDNHLASSLLPVLISSFSFWFVIGAAILPISIASYSLIGEKVEKSLEPLLATPVMDEEILIGKGLAAFIPSIVSNYIGAAIFMFLIDLFTYDKLKYLYFPNWNMAIILLILSPLVCILDIGVNVIISSRFSDVRSAQQLGMLMILPFGVIYVLAEMSVISLTTQNLLILSTVVIILDLIFLYIAKSTFQREEILTKWK